MFNVERLIGVMRARWWVALLVTVLGIAAGIAFALTRPKLYIATASVIVEGKADPVSSMLYGTGTAPGYINTQLEIIRSDRVAQRVVKNLKLVDMADLRKDWESQGSGNVSFESWITELIQRGLDVSVGRAGGSVINIAYAGSEPRFAAAIANAFVQAYMETSIELKIDPAKQYNSFFSEQATEARANLEKAQAKLSRFQQERGLLVTDERVDLETAKLSQLTNELLAIQAQRVDATTRARQATRSADSMQEINANAVVAGLRADIARGEQKLSELSLKYGDNHPAVQEARSGLAELRTRLDQEIRRATTSLGSTATIQTSREAEVRASVDAQRARIMQLKEVRDEGSVLERDVDNAQRMYDMVFNRARQTDLESQNRQANVTVLTSALPPNTPESKVRKHVATSVLLAILAGLAAALLVEQLDQRLRGAADTVTALGLPVIGIMPQPKAERSWRGFLSMNKQRVISGRRLLGSSGKS
ncbi:chain length determinant protein EpsF [Ideonella livida]|uniref:Chain length determinant protein EpsF n=1 Tax=Ideonella livida TaxID=2707176 RepID=A0A7C9PFX5_9BURK|nr:chain length determinant protein EpsF [Ideonella livida]NDY90913.1 chain length determinant protein EpsF [Ideonella livida]